MSFSYEDIVKDDDPIIRKKSEVVSLPISDEDRLLLMNMLEYVRDSQDEDKAEERHLRPAVGIAAVQLGVLKQMIAVVVQDEEDNTMEYALVNPKIISESVQKAYLKNGEGCLSVEEEHSGLVPRSARITVKGYDLLMDEEVSLRVEDYLAVVLQHEIDHFSGILFYDRINLKDPWHTEEGSTLIE